MKVRVIRSFGKYRRGDVLWPQDGLANLWLSKGWVEEAAVDTKAVEEPPADKMIGHESILKRRARARKVITK